MRFQDYTALEKEWLQGLVDKAAVARLTCIQLSAAFTVRASKITNVMGPYSQCGYGVRYLK